MTASLRPSRAIDGKGRTIQELLAGHKYSIDYYQREYKWQQKQVAELIDVGQNLLARGLHEAAYDHNPGFRHFVDSSGLAFRPHAEFKKADLDSRQKLYGKLAEQIWSPDRLKQEAES
jgi:hypothetical protein